MDEPPLGRVEVVERREVVDLDTTLVRLNINNLTDKLYADALYRGFYTPGAPRSVQVTLKTLF